MGERLASRATEGGVNLPNLDEEIQWLKDRLRPDDPRMGNGISDWTITAEYVPNLEVCGTPAYGALCSPEDHDSCLTPEDIAAKRAHFLMFVPKNAQDVKELKVTFFHEARHILYSMIAPLAAKDREAEENATHSIDNFMKNLTPEELSLFRRDMHQNPMARAYRAKETAMPDMEDDKKDKPDKEAPKMAEGNISLDGAAAAEIVATGDANKALEFIKKLLGEAAGALIGGNGAASEPAPVPAPSMGMKPEEAFARQAATDRKEAIEAIIDANPHLDDKQKAMARKMPSVKDARELVASYPRAANQNDPARMGMNENPKTDKHANMKPMARAIATASENPMLRKLSGIGSLEADGIHYEPQDGVLFYVDGTEQINHQRAKLDARRAERRGAA